MGYELPKKTFFSFEKVIANSAENSFNPTFTWYEITGVFLLLNFGVLPKKILLKSLSGCHRTPGS